MSLSSFSRFVLAAFVAFALAGSSQSAMAKGTVHDIHFVKTADKSSP